MATHFEKVFLQEPTDYAFAKLMGDLIADITMQMNGCFAANADIASYVIWIIMFYIFKA